MLYLTKKVTFILITTASFIILLIILTDPNYYDIPDAIEHFVVSNEAAYSIIDYDKDSDNHYKKSSEWIINYNVAQYSSYLVNDGGQYNIEGLLSTCMPKNLTIKKEDLVLIIKSTIENRILAELDLYEMYSIADNYGQRAVVKLNDTFDTAEFNNIAVAFIFRHEFSKDVMENFEINEKGKYIFTYELLNFQMLDLLIVQEPRIKAIASCVQYTFQLPKYLTNWIDLQAKFGIKEISLYDATPNASLFDALNGKAYGDLITLKNYYVKREHFCNFNRFSNSNSNETIEILTKSCNNFYSKTIFSFRSGLHEQITSNDCLIEKGYIYEYVTLYDLDEVVFPRKLNSTKFINDGLYYECNDTKNVCSQDPFSVNIYDYITDLVRSHFKHDKDKLAYIYFTHAFYFVQEDIQIKLFGELESTLHKIYRNDSTIQYPIYIYLEDPERSNVKFSITIEKEHLNYVEYLVRTYNSLGCLYNNYIKHGKMEKNYLRFVYLMTHGGIRMGKCIHYTKNVFATWTHYARKIRNNSYYFVPPAAEGHLITHYRWYVTGYYGRIKTTPITQLKIDFEYLSYLLKQVTDFCVNKY